MAKIDKARIELLHMPSSIHSNRRTVPIYSISLMKAEMYCWFSPHTYIPVCLNVLGQNDSYDDMKIIKMQGMHL